jgi:hypothetical protein
MLNFDMGRIRGRHHQMAFVFAQWEDVILAGDAFGEKSQGAGLSLVEIRFRETERGGKGARQLGGAYAESPGCDLPGVGQRNVARKD